MGTRSYIVRGKGNAAGLCSAPHGAGRRFSRTEARKRFTADDLAERMRGIEYRHGEEWIDEIPMRTRTSTRSWQTPPIWSR
jgi:tRNA-splicing ligase RtcB